jgi:hypothetical protein
MHLDAGPVPVPSGVRPARRTSPVAVYSRIEEAIRNGLLKPRLHAAHRN